MSSNRIAIVVNSCLSFYKKTIPVLLKSAINANINFEDIYIVVGDCDEETGFNKETYDSKEYNISFCRYVCIDYNAAIYITQTESGLSAIKKYTHFFYIHDTVEFLPNFLESISKYINSCHSYISLEPFGSKNIGLFSINWFINNKSEFLKLYINYDKSKKMQIKSGIVDNEEEIRKKCKHLPGCLNEDSLFESNPTSEYYFPLDNNSNYCVDNKYDGLTRMANIYPNVGIIKYQANWGQRPHFVLDL